MGVQGDKRLMARIVTAILRDAGFVQAVVPRFNAGFATSQGFWMRVDGIGDSIPLSVVNAGSGLWGDPTTIRYNRAYVRTLRTAIGKVIGQSAAEQCIAPTADYQTVYVHVPNREHLQQLHQALKRRKIGL